MRLGLCCIFKEQPIKFRSATATACGRLPRDEALLTMSERCANNADSLLAALEYCAAHDIGCFRISSGILPLKTHPDQGYELVNLPRGKQILERFRECGEFARQHNLRTVFHPDQFNVLGSPRETVVEASIRELEYQAEVAEWTNADVLNLHIGGAYGDKQAALEQFRQNLDRLSDRVRQRLAIENDDKIFTVRDLLPLCRAEGLPLVYDVHHHRCLPDGLSVEEATELAMSTWNREPLFHISSPLNGWDGPHPLRHHDYIDVRDFPEFWEDLEITVEIEAKAKELAISQLQQDLAARRPQVRR